VEDKGIAHHDAHYVAAAVPKEACLRMSSELIALSIVELRLTENIS